MKKKILLALTVVAMLVCVFAISVSAASYDKSEVFKATDGTDLALYDSDGNALAWFYDSSAGKYVSKRVGIDFTMSLNNGGKELLPTTAISDTDGNNDTAFPYTVSDMILLNGRDYAAFTYISGRWNSMPIQAIYVNNNFQWINNNSFNGNKTLRVFDIPRDTNSRLHFGSFAFANSALESIYIPINSYFEGTSTFEYSKSFKRAEFHDQWAGELKGYEFNGCSALESIKLPLTITQIPTRFCWQATSLTELTIPSLVTSIGDSAFTDCKIESVVIPSGITQIGTLAFAGNKNLKELTFVTPTETNIVIGDAAFQDCWALTELVLPEGVTTLGFRAFMNCKSLKKLTLPTSLTTLTSTDQFNGAAALEEVVGLENTQLTLISNGMFFGATKWNEFVKLPNTVTSIGTHAFADAGITGVILGSGVTEFSTQPFINCPNLAVVYVPETITSFGTGSFDNGKRTDILFFVTSTDSTYLEGVKSGFGCADVVVYDAYLADSSSYATGRHVISGYNKCEAFYNGIHAEDNNPCVISCDRCKTYGVAKENPAHSLVTNVEYVSFDAAGTKTVSCTNEGCKHNITTPMPALFTNLGFSAAEYPGGGMSIGFKVDKAAILAYEEATGEKVNYGVFAVLAEKIGANDIFGVDGKALDGVIAADITNTGFDIFNLKIVGITDEQDDIDLAMGAYVGTTKDGKTEYAYLQGGTPETGAKYFFASYTDVKAIVDAKNGESAQ